jgi:hypothetical protein
MSTAKANNSAIGPMDQKTLVAADLNGAGVPVGIGPRQVYKAVGCEDAPSSSTGD